MAWKTVIPDFTAAKLRDMLDYYPDTGMLVWKSFNYMSGRSNSQYAGKEAGFLCSEGYVNIIIESRNYKAHRIIWYGNTGEWPIDQIDHINNVRHDNRWCNLREATNQFNQFNRHANKNNKSSGVKGVHRSPLPTGKPWKGLIRKDGIRYHLGYFDTIDEAKLAYENKERELAGMYAKSNCMVN